LRKQKAEIRNQISDIRGRRLITTKAEMLKTEMLKWDSGTRGRRAEDGGRDWGEKLKS
jgi:hypothetical protein